MLVLSTESWILYNTCAEYGYYPGVCGPLSVRQILRPPGHVRYDVMSYHISAYQPHRPVAIVVEEDGLFNGGHVDGRDVMSECVWL